MKSYNVSLIFSADWSIDVDAESAEEAAEIAYNSDEASVSICHQCSNRINLGECIRVIVYDQNGEEVLDDGIEHTEILRLNEKIIQLEAELAAVKGGAK